MAKIITQGKGARRLIRLSSDDILFVMNRLGQTFRQGPPSYDVLQATLAQHPLYIPEEP